MFFVSITKAEATETQKIALKWLLESVVIDMIHNHMAADDAYALVIGRRLDVALRALEGDHAKD